jgi:hypothetical protein
VKTCAFLLLVLALVAIQCPAQSTVVPYTFSTIAGEYEIDGLGGFADGTNGSAQFSNPEGLAVDTSGNVFVADTFNHVIRKLTHRGTNWVVTTVAGQPGVSGYGDSVTPTSALFNAPRGVALDSSGNLFIADTGNNLIRELTQAGTVTTIAGDVAMTTNGGYMDGPGLQAQFDFPSGVAVDSSDNLYVADYYNDAIRKLTKAADLNFWQVSTLGGTTTFSDPWGVAVDAAANVYVADTGNNEIRKITPDGTISTLAGSAPTIDQIFAYYDGIAFPSQDGTGAGAGFFFPYGVAVDSLTNVYVTDTYDCEIRKVTPQGVVTTIGGQPSFENYFIYPYPKGGDADGTGSGALFDAPIGVAVDDDGNVYVGDTDNGDIREGVAPVVKVIALEVTQVIQDWSNTIPLIQGKDTYVRAHMQLPSSENLPLMLTGALLYGIGANGVSLGDPLTPINPGASLYVRTANASNTFIRENFSKSLNFRLPPAWLTGTNTLQLAWPGGLQPANLVSSNCSVQAAFVPGGVLQVKFFDVQWTNFDGTTHQLGASINDLVNRVLSCFPVSSVDATFATLALSGLQTPDFGVNPNSFVSMVNSKLYHQRAEDIANQGPGAAVVGNRIYHGAIQADPGVNAKGQPTNIDGLAALPFPSFVSCATVVGTYGQGRQSVSHELSHNLGNHHDVSSNLFGTILVPDAIFGPKLFALGACTETGPSNSVYPLFQPVADYPAPGMRPALGLLPTSGAGDNSFIFGLDAFTVPNNSISPVVSPIEIEYQDTNCYYDLMSYCRNGGPEDLWPSSFTYTSLIGSINSTFGVPNPALREAAGLMARSKQTRRSRTRKPPGPQRPVPQGDGENYLIVRGTVDFNSGTAQFLPCLPLTTSNAPPAESPGTTFLLQALDGTGAVLETNQFALQPSVGEGTSTNLTADFFVAVTNNPSIHTLVLWGNGAMLTTLTASPTAPTVTLTAPNGGQTFSSGTIDVAWNGSDSDGDTLTYTVQFSPDDGASWDTLAVDWPGPTLGINSSQLETTTEGLIRVIASDGFNTSSAQSSATFTIQPHAPIVTINTPMTGSLFIGDQQVFLDATATDMQDGPLTGTNVQWYSSRDGSLGAGAIVNFAASVLSEGYHTITATATDSDGLTNSAETSVLVLRYQPPQLNIQVNPGVVEFGSYYPPYGTVSWPAYYTNYVLQSSANLTSGWADFTNIPAEPIANLQSLNISATNTTAFFRLALQP